MSDLPPVNEDMIAKTVGAQVVLDPTSTAAQGAKGVHRYEPHNIIHLAAGYTELGLNPRDPNAGAPLPEAPATEPPVNVDVPYVSQTGAELSCTMGNWTGEPTSYAYGWQLDGVSAGADVATYAVQSADIGKSATCIVTATNDLGATAAPPSNAVVVA